MGKNLMNCDYRVLRLPLLSHGGPKKSPDCMRAARRKEVTKVHSGDKG
jgi:hypothetical protein